MMCVTGALLMYERQIKDWADNDYYDIGHENATRLSVDEILAVARTSDTNPNSIAFFSDTEKLPVMALGRRNTTYVNPYTGETLGRGNRALADFLGAIRGWHRWFDLSGESRTVGRAATGAANLLFLFLLVTGIYLWLPPLYRWLVIKPRLTFNDKVNNAKARDYNWHHVFGFWTLVPMLAMVVTGVTISYSWGDKVVYFLAGEEIPERGRAPPAGRGGGREVPFDAATALPLQSHFEFAAAQTDDWRRIDVQIPRPQSSTVNVVIDNGTGGEPTRKRTLVLHRNSGEILRTEDFEDRTPAGQVLGYFRWLHTGEALGIVGQTIAGLASALGAIMVWTGLALAYRRLIQPLFRRQQHN